MDFISLRDDHDWYDSCVGGYNELPSKEDLDAIFESEKAPFRMYIVNNETGEVVYYREKQGEGTPKQMPKIGGL